MGWSRYFTDKNMISFWYGTASASVVTSLLVSEVSACKESMGIFCSHHLWNQSSLRVGLQIPSLSMCSLVHLHNKVKLIHWLLLYFFFLFFLPSSSSLTYRYTLHPPVLEHLTDWGCNSNGLPIQTHLHQQVTVFVYVTGRRIGMTLNQVECSPHQC